MTKRKSSTSADVQNQNTTNLSESDKLIVISLEDYIALKTKVEMLEKFILKGEK